MSADRRLGVLGGTFDPIHNGHLAAGEAVFHALKLHELQVIPAHDPPHRPVDPRASAFHRFALAALAIDGRPGWRLSDLEVTRTGPSYSALTLRALHAEGWRPSQIFFILGADAFAEIATWYDFPLVLDDANFAVVARPGTTLEELRARVDRGRFADAAIPAGGQTACFLIDAATPDVSSTGIRSRLAAGQPIDELVPPAVARYIHSHRLYQPATVDNLHGQTQRIHG